MAVKKTQIEDKAVRPEKEKQSAPSGERKREFNYPDRGVTVKASDKAEADKKVRNVPGLREEEADNGKKDKEDGQVK